VSFADTTEVRFIVLLIVPRFSRRVFFVSPGAYCTPHSPIQYNSCPPRFTSDVGRVMDLIINSLYSDRDIFLRELVSNAADACDKKRFLSITADGSNSVADPPEIKIKANMDDNTLTLEDSGVGMTKDELVS
jgi:Histidine kinase-, DNA gyrase B-, and HSP90-like ATPase